MTTNSPVNFDDTKIALGHRSRLDLLRAKGLFQTIAHPAIAKSGQTLALAALKLKLPFVTTVLKRSLFQQFCGGESIEDCQESIEFLDSHGIASVLDYSVEAESGASNFAANYEEIKRTVIASADSPAIRFSVFKLSALAETDLLQRRSLGELSVQSDLDEWDLLVSRVSSLCELAEERGICIFIDAEESWLQDSIDEIVVQMMQAHNQKRPVVYGTIQLYLKDGMTRMQSIAKSCPFPAFKLVRGAYMEKERQRAEDFGLESPIQPDKQSSDANFDQAAAWCLQKNVHFCAGTHNEASCQLILDVLEKEPEKLSLVEFCQLFGMSDHITFNLAHSGYSASKYLPYGPVRKVVPYLFRRAQENTSVEGQTGRELALIEQELERRRRS